jgi:hypothetical protein
LRQALDAHCRKHLPASDAVEYAHHQPFHWELEFPDVFACAHDRPLNLHAASPPSSTRGFDVILGNPPFVDMKKIVRRHKELDHYWRRCRSFVTAQGIYDTYMLFFERAIALSEPTGRVGFLTPIPWLTQVGGAPLRRLLSASGAVRIVDLSADAYFSSAVVKIDRGVTCDAIEVEHPDRLTRLSHTTVDRLFESQIRIDVAPEALPILEKIRQHSKPLSAYYTPTFGLRACSRTKGSFRKQHLLKPRDECTNPVRYLEAEELGSSSINWSGRWLDYQPYLIYSPRTPSLFESPKVLVPSLLGRRVLHAILDTDGFYADQSLVCISEAHLLPALACGETRPSLNSVAHQINSAIVSFFFAHAIVGEALGGGAIHATPGLIGRLPMFAWVIPTEQHGAAVDEQLATFCGLSAKEYARVTTWYANTR